LRERYLKSCTLSHNGLLCEFDLSELCSVGHHVLVLDTHYTTAPGSSELLVFVELSTEVLGEELKVLEVLLADFGQCNAGGSLGVNKLSEACLALDEGKGIPFFLPFLDSASDWSLVFFSFLVSGLYLASNLRSWLAIEILIISIEDRRERRVKRNAVVLDTRTYLGSYRWSLRIG
jgi:hypothetical protein